MLKLLVLFFVLINLRSIDCQDHIGTDQLDDIPLRRTVIKIDHCPPGTKFDGQGECKQYL